VCVCNYMNHTLDARLSLFPHQGLQLRCAAATGSYSLWGRNTGDGRNNDRANASVARPVPVRLVCPSTYTVYRYPEALFSQRCIAFPYTAVPNALSMQHVCMQSNEAVVRQPAHRLSVSSIAACFLSQTAEADKTSGGPWEEAGQCYAGLLEGHIETL
jgi:hypothetical protein